MGYNTTIVVMNDALNDIENDKDFGLKLAKAVKKLSTANGSAVDIQAGHHGNAATVIESHHADEIRLVAVGGNYGADLGYHGRYDSKNKDLLKSLANSMGYDLKKKPKAKTSKS